MTDDIIPWWSSLQHEGLLLSDTVVLAAFDEPLPPLSRWHSDRLRSHVDSVGERPASDFAATILREVCGFGAGDHGLWIGGQDITAERYSHRLVTGESWRPRLVWTGAHGASLPLFVDDEPRLGVGRSRRAIARALEWARGKGQPFVLLTNGRQLRLLYVASDHHASVEWDASLWFEAGQPGPQIEALRRLLSPALLTPPAADAPAPLLDLVRRSRQGVTEFTSILGERVRQAVEWLIHCHAPYLQDAPDRAAVYHAATRVVMRLVVGLFAESRDLFPRGNPVYFDAYSLTGLRDRLLRDGAGGYANRARHRYAAWPRVLGLFRLIHDGSHHQLLALPRYGGTLFAPGAERDPDPVRRALALFESACFRANPPIMSDADVAKLLDLLTLCPMPIRRGRSTRWQTMPVNFEALSTQYIGILYEGLLDYELERAPAGDPIVFLNLGDQPALPLSRLEAMDESEIPELLKVFKQKKGLTVDGDEEDAEDAEAEENADETPAVAEPVPEEEQAVPDRERVLIWARRAALKAKAVKPYDGADPVRQQSYREKLDAAANAMIARIVEPGAFYLVRWGGTRKGQGSFYTRPQLVAPTVRRTLEPLCYADGAPKPPGELLALKICDPGMGSGSFLVGALNYATEALWRSLVHHRWLVEQGEGWGRGPGLPVGEPAWFRECVRDLPATAEDAEDRIRARLKRLVVEHSIYGVDLDPMAVELGRLSLWVETMDRDLPFGFLDHKLKCGNSLVGCWIDRFQDYPALCLHRPGDDAGDKAHKTGVHHPPGARSDALKNFRDTRLKPALAHWIEAQDPGTFGFVREGYSLDDIHADAVRLFQELHAIPIHDPEARAAFYRDRIAGDFALNGLRTAMDTWCALWFWPLDRIDDFILPDQFTRPADEPAAIARDVARRHRFFHWEVEFPDVFLHEARRGGFDAILGNPPWEVQKPNSKEFFSNHDPLYRTYGKQAALGKQRELFERAPDIEAGWIDYMARFKAMSNWCGHVGHPWGDPADDWTRFSLQRGRRNEELHAQWRARRALRHGYADAAHPFRHQGSADLNTYKLFLEHMHALLRPGGRLGVIVPSNIYTDKGSTALRTLFLDRCSWEWLFGFENREKVFDIDSRFKFCPLIVEKGGRTEAIRTAFMRRSLADWENAERFELAYPREQVDRFSPKSRAILELRSARDIAILDKMYRNGVLLGDEGPDGWGLKYAREFDMTTDSKLFPPRPEWEARGYVPDEYGHWLKGAWRPVSDFEFRISDFARWATESWTRSRSVLTRPAGLILSRDGTQAIRIEAIEDVALPLYEGRMIDHFDFSAKGWVSGKGRSAVWRDVPWENKVIEPQFLISQTVAAIASPLRVSFLDIGSATNARSMIATVLENHPSGNVAPILTQEAGSTRDLALCAVLNSLVFDYAVRMRLGGLHLNFFVIDEAPLLMPRRATDVIAELAKESLSLSFLASRGAGVWMQLRSAFHDGRYGQAKAFAPTERVRRRSVVDAIVAHSFGLTFDDYIVVLAACDHPVAALKSDEFTRTLDPKGFWRVDADKEPELRHTVLSLVAFRDLQEKGLEAFLAQNEGEGWMLPETLRLADYGLGHDERAHDPQPVASRLGPRFHPWQLEGTVQESWEECRRHAENLRRIRAIGLPPPEPAAPAAVREAPATYGTPPALDLLGEPLKDATPRRKKP